MWDSSICRQILVQIRNDVSLDPHVFHVKGYAGGGDGIDPGGVIHKISGKGGVGDLFSLEVAGQLIKNGRDDLQMGKLFGTYLIVKIVYDTIWVLST